MQLRLCLEGFMKKKPSIHPKSLHPKKRSRLDYHKYLMVNKYLIIVGALVFIFVCGYIIIQDSSGSKTNSNTLSNETPVQASDTYHISVIDNSTGGNVYNNTQLMEYINNTPAITEVLEESKKGTPLVTFGNGSEPRVMIVAGVHGAELPSQIAACNLINDLNGKNIKGTIYIIPFAIPNDTATDNRLLNGVDPDREAHISGTPLNVIIKTSKTLNVTMLADFHSAQPNDVPGKNCIIYDPENPESLKLARFINNKTKSPLIRVGNYSGVLSTVSNGNGITSVVCEVLSAHSKVEPGSVELSYGYMMSFLEYAGVYNNSTGNENQINQTQ